MAKTANKSHNEVKELKSRIRDLEKEVRRLKKENSYYKKHQHMYEEIPETEEDIQEQKEIEVIKNGINCPHCGKGILREFEIMPGKVFGTCPICEYREKLK